jgi:hypothetical protein
MDEPALRRALRRGAQVPHSRPRTRDRRGRRGLAHEPRERSRRPTRGATPDLRLLRGLSPPSWKHGGWCHIDPSGERRLYVERHAWCGNFQHDAAPSAAPWRRLICTSTKRAGHAAYAERWRYAGDYRDGFAVVQARRRPLDAHRRRWAVPCTKDAGSSISTYFHKGFARARDAVWMVARGPHRPAHLHPPIQCRRTIL